MLYDDVDIVGGPKAQIKWKIANLSKVIKCAQRFCTDFKLLVKTLVRKHEKNIHDCQDICYQ